jgi:hypothetical protein
VQKAAAISKSGTQKVKKAVSAVKAAPAKAAAKAKKGGLPFFN